MHKFFWFHILLPAQLSFGYSSSAGSSGYFLGAYPSYTCRWLVQLPASPKLVWAIIFLGNQVFDMWGVHEVAHHITNPCRTGNKNNRWPQTSTLRGSPPGWCLPLAGAVCHMHVTCMEHSLLILWNQISHPITYLLAGMLHSNNLWKIRTMLTIPLSNFIINWRSWFGTKT